MRDIPGRTAIDPTAIRAGLSNLLGIKGVRSAPDSVNMEAVIPQIEIGQQGYAILNNDDALLQCEAAFGLSLAGLQSKTCRVLSYVLASGLDGQIVVPVNHNFYFWGIKWYWNTNAAGAAALNGKYVSMEWANLINVAGTVCEVEKYFGTGICRTGILQYHPGGEQFFPLTRQNIYIVPAGVNCQITVWLQDGTNFPANTYMYYRLVGQAVPIGVQIPQNI